MKKLLNAAVLILGLGIATFIGLYYNHYEQWKGILLLFATVFITLLVFYLINRKQFN